LTNDIVKTIIDSNDYVRLRLVTSGTKVFGRQEGKGPDMSFRVLCDGLPVVLPFIPPAFILTGDIQSLRTLMKGYYPLLASFPEHFRSVMEAQRESALLIVESDPDLVDSQPWETISFASQLEIRMV
jgi:multisite-specific tRNA:(cytosine-C5)-methyltransferase